MVKYRMKIYLLIVSFMLGIVHFTFQLFSRIESIAEKLKCMSILGVGNDT